MWTEPRGLRPAHEMRSLVSSMGFWLEHSSLTDLSTPSSVYLTYAPITPPPSRLRLLLMPLFLLLASATPRGSEHLAYHGGNSLHNRYLDWRCEAHFASPATEGLMDTVSYDRP